MHIDIYPDNTAKVSYIGDGSHACFNIYNKMIECFKAKEGNCGESVKKWDVCIRTAHEKKS